MAINDLDVVQASTILNAAVAQAQGSVAISTQLDTKDFVTVATTALKTGLDKLNTGLSQVLSRTIFSARPYTRKFKVLEADAIRYGNHVRKINYIDKPAVNDPGYALVNGPGVDMYAISKPQVIQTNFYGYNTFDYVQTIYKEQLNMALKGPEEWAGFLGGLLQTVQNKIEQFHEESARMALLNLIGGHINLNASTDCVIHILTEYNAYAGTSLTATTVFYPANFPDFARWLYARLETLSRMLQERSRNRHMNLTAGDIMRHTPAEDQRLIMLAGDMDLVKTNVLATTYNSEYLKTIPREDVTFWQNIELPSDINLGASFMKADGTIDNAVATAANVFGVLFDREAVGYTMVNQSYEVTPYNTAGKYWNHYWSFQDRYWNDFTENAIILVLD